MQVVLVYIQPFRRNLLLQRKIAKKFTQTLLFEGLKVVQSHRC